LTNLVPRRLEENLALHRSVAAGLVEPNPEASSPMTVPFESEKLVALFEYVAKGLAWHHWGLRIARTSAVWVGLLSRRGEAVFSHLFAHRANERVVKALGAGTFEYQGTRSSENPQLTIWRFSLYGGALFSGAPDAPDEFNSVVGAVTGSAEVIAKFATASEGGPEPSATA
jgi:hypothetical protein